MSSKNHCQVLLTKAGMQELAKILDPFLQKGRSGHFIEGKKADSNGAFIVVETMVEGVNLWIPIHFVACVGFGVNSSAIGFLQKKGRRSNQTPHGIVANRAKP
ncbi:MAG: hypothetical protein A2498_06185 [Lentisphaerae bacterium RIFOXYC12_FULL_60_16]|nr:MAG: hypothetical protein A2498_06185 [Lentisphaerae bacterium RIFOXYC12_FULL_60_16]